MEMGTPRFSFCLKQLLAGPVLVTKDQSDLAGYCAALLIKATYYPSGRYLLTIRGIFFWFNSLMAICRGSVSPSKSTSTGAFILIAQRQQNPSPPRQKSPEQT